MRYLLAIAIFLVILFPYVSSAGWDNDEDGTGDACEVSQPNPTRQRRCWWNFTATESTGNSNFLKVDQCENWSVGFIPDWDGTGTTATIQVMECLDDADTNACFVVESATLTSAVPKIYGADGTWIYIDIITAAGAGENARVEFDCNQ